MQRILSPILNISIFNNANCNEKVILYLTEEQFVPLFNTLLALLYFKATLLKPSLYNIV